MKPTTPILLSLLAFASGPAGAGVLDYDLQDEFVHINRGGLHVRGLSIQSLGQRWVGRARHSAPATDPGRSLVPPVGDWTDLEIALAGPVILQLERGDQRFTWRLDLGDTWTVPLQDPDARGPLQLDLDLPAWALGLGDVGPEHPLHDRLAAAVRDGAVLAAP